MVARSYRLREEADVRRVRSRGKAFAHGPLVARILPNDLEPPQNRYTVIAGKKCGNSVERNRLKRLTREALRGLHPHLLPGHDIALVVRGNRIELPTLEIAQETLLRILTRANLFVPNASIPQPGDQVTASWLLKRPALEELS